MKGKKKPPAFVAPPLGPRPPGNAEVANLLRELALFLEMDAVQWKPQAYERAAYAIAALDRPVADLYREAGMKGLLGIPGIGEGIAERIAGMLSTGACADLEALRAKTPIKLLELASIGGVGPKRAHELWKQLGVCTLVELEAAARAGRIRGVPHFGAKTEQKILEAIALHAQLAGRSPLGEVLDLARRMEAGLADFQKVGQASIAGSIRRHRDTIGDLDLLVSTNTPDAVLAQMTSLPDVREVVAHGPQKIVVRLTNDLSADVRMVPPECYGAALLYFTGSKAHNVALRKLAQRRGWKLNEYGLFDGETRLAGRTEEEVYEHLGLAYVPPELREDEGEVALAKAHGLPDLVAAEDLRGDLQTHTTWTDGSASIEAMASAARALGREYIVFTDHTRDLAMTGGLDEARLREEVKEIRRVGKKLRGIRLLCGAEVNIRPDGTLDLADEMLAELDFVGAAIHSHFDQPREVMTARLVRAIEHPFVDAIFHPTCRILGRRRPIELDFDAVARACARTGTLLEVDAQRERLDLPDALVRTALSLGVRLSIDSDAHAPDELRWIETYGLGTARRGWATKAQVANTLPVDELLASLKRARALRPGRA